MFSYMAQVPIGRTNIDCGHCVCQSHTSQVKRKEVKEAGKNKKKIGKNREWEKKALKRVRIIPIHWLLS